MEHRLAIAAAGCAIAMLANPGAGLSPEGHDRHDLICRLYLDPHDHFTRVVPSSTSGRARLRSNAALSTIQVNYSGFTPEAQTAFQAAIDIWLTQVSSPVPIVVDAQYTNLGSTGLLGQAAFRSMSANFSGAPIANVLYPGPIANRLSGVDRNGATTEIAVTLNSATNWAYSTSGVPVAGKVDFVSVVLHELGHGLGFAGSAAMSSAGAGSLGSGGRPYAYDVAVVDSAGNSVLNQTLYPNNTTTLGALLRGIGVSGNGLFWIGPRAIAANGGQRPRLFTPSTYLHGSSFSHLDDATYPPGTLNSLMTPTLGTAEVIHTPGGIVNGMLGDMGWGEQCSYGLSQPLVAVPAGGGSVQTTLSTTAGCSWTASTSASFASIVSETSGSGSTVVRVVIAPNAGTNPRLATVQIADQTFTIAQFGTVPCSYSIDPTAAAVAGAGGTGTVDLQTLPECPWMATAANPDQASITSDRSGVGPATVAYAVAASTSSSPRNVTLHIAGQPFVIAQGPAPPAMTLDRTALRFAAVATGAGFTSSTSAQMVRLTQAGTGTVSWTATSSSPWLAVSPASGTGPAALSISTQHAIALSATQTGTVTLTYTGASNPSSSIAVTLTALEPWQAAAPFGAFDTPLDGTTGVVGSIPVTGWAMDDVEVTRVRIFRDPVPGEPAGLIYIGDADLVDGARPDVQAQFSSLPRSSRGGWGYLMLTNFLPSFGNGSFRLTAIAEDGEGNATVLGSKTIVCDNANSTAPFGAIDTPAQGASVSGDLINFGWVLSPAPRRSDPPGGGTVQIVIDGNFITAVPSGWTSRADLTALFPLGAFPGIATALGVAAIDTRTLSNGVHTIAWVVTDDHGEASGIGSRYFTVSNGSALTARAQPAAPGLPPPPSSLQWRRGFDRHAPYEQTRADAQGLFTIRAEEIERVELRVAAGDGGAMRIGDQLRPLPVGSRLDPATGTFTWQPGVAFVGAYDFVFGGRRVRIVLEPRGSRNAAASAVVTHSTPTTITGSFAPARTVRAEVR